MAMNSETFQVYKHSGKFGFHGPLLALTMAIVAGFPLGFAYAYLVKWIPFVYVNFLGTLGYGFLFGLLAGWAMRFGKVRNTPVACVTALLTGLIALYFSWNGHVHATFAQAPLFCWPGDIVFAMKLLYQHGTWALHGGDNVTGIPLAIVWLVEAGVIVGIATTVVLGMVRDTPFCEVNQCWLDRKKTISTLELFTDPALLAALKSGDLSPLTQAKPKPVGADAWTRLILKHSPRCDIYRTVRIQNISIERLKNGKTKEKAQDITGDLIIPPPMFDLISKFENFKPAEPAVEQA